MNWLLFGTLLPTAAVSCLAIYLIRHYAPRLGLIDQPGHRKVHTQPVPLGGGIGIWLGVLVPLALGQLGLLLTRVTPDGATLFGIPLPESVFMHIGGLVQQSGDLWVLLAAGTLLMLLGLADDRRGLDWKLRIGIQTLIATGLVAGGWRLSFFVDNVWLTGAVSVLWIVGLINTFNMLDNMDALSGGVAAISASLLAAVLLIAPDPVDHGPQLFVAGFLLVLVGALLGFLWHNRPPAKIFMGDSGSYFIGFWLAIGTTMATFAGESLPRHTILAPLCVLAVPLYDTLTVVLIRLASGKSPFEGDKNHFSHRLTDLGLSKTQAVLTIYLTTATTGLGALLLYQVNWQGAIVVLLMIACVLTVIAILELSARRQLREHPPRR